MMNNSNNNGTMGGPPSLQPMRAAPAWANPSQQQPVVTQQVVQQHEEELFGAYSTLDEPVRETIMRDVRAVGSKLRIVLSPLDRNAVLSYAGYSGVSQSAVPQQGDESDAVGVDPSLEQQTPQQQAVAGISESDRRVIQSLKDWDLWGPLIVCLFLAVTLSAKAPKDQASLVFAAVFFAVWVGGTVVTMNAQLLGGSISFFQSMCVLGYCIFPLALAAFVIGLLKIVPYVKNWIWLDMIFVFVGFLWAIRASSIFIGMYVKEERRFLALYPVFLFYTFLGWMILLF